MHDSITEIRVAAAIERSLRDGQSSGFCIECGAEIDDVAFDARAWPCPHCTSSRVFGAQEIAFTDMNEPAPPISPE